MESPFDEGAMGVWHAAVWRHSASPGTWFVRISSTTDLETSADHVSRDVDEVCAHLRAWLLEVTA